MIFINKYNHSCCRLFFWTFLVLGASWVFLDPNCTVDLCGQESESNCTVYSMYCLDKRVLSDEYRGPGLLAGVWCGSYPTTWTPSHQKIVSFSVGRTEWWEGGEGWSLKGAKSYDGEKDKSSINHSILSGLGSPGRHRQASQVRGHVREQRGPQPNFTHFYL